MNKTSPSADDPRPPRRPMAPAIEPATVTSCRDPDEADRLLGGELAGYVYRRDGHANADQLAEACRAHHAPSDGTSVDVDAVITASGMAALAAAALATLRSGDHAAVAHPLYGRTSTLFSTELARLGITSSEFHAADAATLAAACTDATRLVVVEAITNPTLDVADLPRLAEVTHRHGAKLLVDNTLAGPTVCRPLDHGADLVVESLTKSMNGHSDVLLGLLCGRRHAFDRVRDVLATWGAVASPFECWLAARGLKTLDLRLRSASDSALALARHLADRSDVETVLYPGLTDHPHHQTANRIFRGRFGHMLAFTLSGGTDAVTRLITHGDIPFSPSLGELETTLSHPASTSHRSLTEDQRRAVGIHPGTVRLSVGIEPTDELIVRLSRALDATV